jgi:hypothetical protein
MFNGSVHFLFKVRQISNQALMITTMGVRADIREEVWKETVTKIHGQPTNQDLTILEN